MTEIARRLNYPPSSTSALLKSLLDLGYLDCDRKARTYVPTARISLVGGWVRNRAGGDLETIAPALHEAMRLTTFIASRNQLERAGRGGGGHHPAHHARPDRGAYAGRAAADRPRRAAAGDVRHDRATRAR
jgi:IclR helix-turn-helix domain